MLHLIRHSKARAGARLAISIASILGAMASAPALAQEPGAAAAEAPAKGTAAPDPAPAPAGAPPKPQVDLGRLLKLPDSYSQPSESRRGKSQAEWHGRFETVRLDLAAAVTALEAAKTELDEAAGDSSSWAVAAPGTAPNPENTPLSYKLRQEIRRQRENLKRAERQLRALEIEADLAGVPPAWRAPEVEIPPQDRNEITIYGDGLGESQ